MAHVALDMIRIYRIPIITFVAIPTRARKILVQVVAVTIVAASPDMTARQRKSCIAMIERRRTPHARSMTWSAIICEARQYVSRIRRLVVLRLMTLETIIVEHQLIVIVRVTLHALGRTMPTRQR